MKYLYWLSAIVCMGCTPSTDQKNTQGSTMSLYMGTYTSGESKGIYRAVFDPGSGTLSPPELVADTENPSFLRIDKSNLRMFAVNELEAGMMTTFKIGEKLVPTTSVPTAGSYPCYIGMSDRHLAIANYGSGNVVVLDPGGEGADNVPFLFRHEGELGPQTDRQEAPHGHYSNFYRDRLYSVDLGIDEVKLIRIDEDEVVTALKLAPGDGPRHMTFYESTAFIVNELSNTVVAASIQSDGTLQPVDRISTLPEESEGKSQAADLHISPDGRYLYASNRGHNSIAVIQVAPNGGLTLLTTEPVRGDWPRNFAISEKGDWLFVANQYSGNITVFSIDKTSGLLTFTGTEIAVPDPTCVALL